MPTQTMAGGDVAEIDGAPPVDEEAILETTLVGFSVSYLDAPRGEKTESKCLEMRLREWQKSLAGLLNF